MKKLLVLVGLMGLAFLVNRFAQRSKPEAAAPTPASTHEPASQEEVGAMIPAFNFISQDEERFLSEKLADKVWVANFIFTSCESMCPMIAQKMQGLQAEFLNENSLRLVSFSLDPENDTPLKLKAYAQKYHADAHWQFLTGNWREIKTLMQDGFKVAAPDQPASHTDRLVLVDRGMKIYGYYTANSAEDIIRLKTDIRQLVASL